MRVVAKFQTRDGTLHDTRALAERHLDKLYGAALTELARELVQCDGKYRATLDFLDKNLDRFSVLLQYRDDRILVSSEDE